MRQFMLLAAVFGFFVAVGSASGQVCRRSLTAQITGSIGDYPSQPPPIDALRALGPDAIDEMSAIRGRLVAQRAELENLPKQPPDAADEINHLSRQLARLDALMDQVGMQKYCSRSRLYWHTDLEQAKAAARESGKPILSLRMLGNLNEEFSCANSRFFRTTLYANDEISKVLRENFVLHWKSVRPVPKVTIDFGDGRKLERTLTGNSVHYILTAEGDVVEALPGLYGPRAFLRKINEGLSLARHVAPLAADERRQAIAEHHAREVAHSAEQFAQDLAKVRPVDLAAIQRLADHGQLRNDYQTSQSPPPAPRAIAAGQLARPKGQIERPILAAALPSVPSPEQLTDEALWRAIAALHAEEAQLDDASRDLIRSQNPTAALAGRLAITKRRVEDPMVRLVGSLQESIALDSVRNEYQLHRRIHQWLAEASYRPDIETLNERVYAEIFLTPSSDPWLGLAPVDVYTALPNGGIVREGEIR